MQLHFWSTTSYKNYGEAVASGEVYVCDAPAFEDEVDRWGFNGGVLCDAMQAVITALECLGMAGSVDCVLVRDGERIQWGRDDD